MWNFFGLNWKHKNFWLPKISQPTCIGGSSSAQQMKLPQITQQAKPSVREGVDGVEWVGFINLDDFLVQKCAIKKIPGHLLRSPGFRGVTFKEDGITPWSTFSV